MLKLIDKRRAHTGWANVHESVWAFASAKQHLSALGGMEKPLSQALHRNFLALVLVDSQVPWARCR